MLDKKIIQPELQTAYARLTALERTPRTVVFSVISDLHSINIDLDTAAAGKRNTLPVIALTHEADALANFDFHADLGDTGLELPENDSPDAAEKLLAQFAREHLKSAKTTLVCMGNHDTAFESITPEQFGTILLRPQAARNPDLVLSDNASYGYCDFPAKRVRVFFLNTGRTYESTPAQNAFVQTKLTELSGDWGAIFLAHYAPHPAGRWAAPWSPPEWSLNPMMQKLVNIIQSSARSMLLFCGDSHFDAEFSLGRVPGFVTQGYGGIEPGWIPQGGCRIELDTRKNFLMEWVVVQPETRKIKVIRAGTGGEKADRTASF